MLFDEGLDKTIKTIGTEDGKLSAGVGYIFIPDNDAVDRDDFVADCLRTKRVTIHGGVGYGTIQDVPIDESVLQRVTFPKEKGVKSTPVVWVNIPVFNKPVIIAVLQYDNDFTSLDELERSFSLVNGDKHIEFSARAKESTVDISIKGDASEPGILNLNVTNESKSCEVNVFVKGKTVINSTEELTIRSDKKINFKAVDSENVDKFTMTYEVGKGLTYVDEFKNEVTINGDKIQIKSGKEKIILQNGAQPLVLGDTLKSLLEAMLDAISSLTVGTVFGPSTVPINATVFQTIKSNLNTMLSKVSKTD